MRAGDESVARYTSRRARSHTFALFMHRGDLARVLGKRKEYVYRRGDRSV